MRYRRFPAVQIATVFFFALLCASLAFWGVKLFAPRAPIAPVAALADTTGPANVEPAVALFGAPAAPVVKTAEPVNITVSGVVSDGNGGAAILGVDGKPGRPYYPGDRLADGTLVVSITADRILLDRGGRAVEVQAPARGSVAVLSGSATAPAAPAATPPGRGAAAPPPPAPSGRPAPPNLPPLPAHGAAAAPAQPPTPQAPPTAAGVASGQMPTTAAGFAAGMSGAMPGGPASQPPAGGFIPGTGGAAPQFPGGAPGNPGTPPPDPTTMPPTSRGPQ